MTECGAVIGLVGHFDKLSDQTSSVTERVDYGMTDQSALIP